MRLTDGFKCQIQRATKQKQSKSRTLSLFGLIHLMKCGLAAVILSIRIPKDVLQKKKVITNLIVLHHALS